LAGGRALAAYRQSRAALKRLAALACPAAAPQAVTTPPAGQTWRSYYYLGGQRIAMRVRTNSTNVVYYLHSDHLGSTSLATCGSGSACGGNGAAIPNSRTWYKPYGEVRGGGSGSPTDFGFNGQRGEPSLGGLLDYHARYYDPLLARFLSADSIVPSPSSPQSLNRYSYCLGNPVKYVDPTGHFTEQAIFDYLLNLYGDERRAGAILSKWRGDTEWWAMISAAQAGDIIFGTEDMRLVKGGTPADRSSPAGFQFQFQGEGMDKLTGLVNVGARDMANLEEIRRGVSSEYVGQYGYNSYQKVCLWEWVGFLRHTDGSEPMFWIRAGYEVTQKTTSDQVRFWDGVAWSVVTGYAVGRLTKFLPQRLPPKAVTALELLGGGLAGSWAANYWEDSLDMQWGDVQTHIGPAYFNFQYVVGQGWTREKKP